MLKSSMLRFAFGLRPCQCAHVRAAFGVQSRRCTWIEQSLQHTLQLTGRLTLRLTPVTSRSWLQCTCVTSWLLNSSDSAL